MYTLFNVWALGLLVVVPTGVAAAWRHREFREKHGLGVPLPMWPGIVWSVVWGGVIVSQVVPWLVGQLDPFMVTTVSTLTIVSLMPIAFYDALTMIYE